MKLISEPAISLSHSPLPFQTLLPEEDDQVRWTRLIRQFQQLRADDPQVAAGYLLGAERALRELLQKARGLTQQTSRTLALLATVGQLVESSFG